MSIALLLGLSGTAQAQDGVVEINQIRALAGGITAGDTPGFPVSINAAGSYRLTGHLTVPNQNTTAIFVAVADVTLDLNGFALQGVTTCTQDSGTLAVTCAPLGSGAGIETASTAENVTVRRGTVRGFGRWGINLSGDGGRVEHVRAVSNGLSGMAVNALTLTRGGSVRHSTGVRNGSDGIWIGSDGLARANVATGNGRWGIGANEHSLALDNTLTENFDEGLRMTSGSGYGNNVVSANNGGNANPQVNGGNEIGSNVCGLDTTCP